MERIARAGLKSARKEKVVNAFVSAFTKSTWKVWNVQRYDKLNLVKSFLLTPAAEDLICNSTNDAKPRQK
jgi:hypothetical protein